MGLVRADCAERTPKDPIMYTVSRILSVALFTLLLFLTTDLPPPAIHAYAAEPSYSFELNGCVLHEGFVPIPHTGRRHLLYLLDQLAPAAGEDPREYSVDIIRETSGPEYINAITCASSKVIWVSRKAFQELYGYEPSLAFLMAHEIAHGAHQSVSSMKRGWVSPAEQQLRSQLTNRQLHEIAVDQSAAEIMLKAGYTTETILAGARYILWQDGADLILQEGPSHPGGWDRLALLRYYLNRRPVAGASVAGRVLPR